MTFGRVVRAVIKPFYKLLYPIKIEGMENFDKDIPFVLCANHRSNWDAVALFVACPRQLYFMAKEELFRNKLLGWILKKVGAFPVKRNQSDLAAIKTAVGTLKKGNILGIFPQGTRTDDVEDDAAKAGAIVIANMAQAPILPAAIISDYKLFHKTTIRFGKMYYFNEERKKLTNEERQALACELMGEIRKLWEEEK